MNLNDPLANALLEVGIFPGDTVLAIFGQSLPTSPAPADTLLSAIISYLGTEGTIAVPGFAFDTRQGAVRLPPFADALTHFPGASISAHPTHPIAAAGRLAESITQTHPIESAFGKSSPVFRLIESDAKLLQIGSEFSENPTVFVAEEIVGVPYAGRSRPILISLRSGKTVTRWMRQPGCHRGFGALADELFDHGLMIETCAGDVKIRAVGMKAVFEAASEALSMSPDSLLCLEADCVLCAEARAMIDADAAERSDKQITEQAEDDERMTRELEQRLSGIARLIDPSEADFSPN